MVPSRIFSRSKTPWGSSYAPSLPSPTTAGALTVPVVLPAAERHQVESHSKWQRAFLFGPRLSGLRAISLWRRVIFHRAAGPQFVYPGTSCRASRSLPSWTSVDKVGTNIPVKAAVWTVFSPFG